ncbi:sensor histidine kinase [Dactylosporangium sp. AC04546]|uniref:sensor histidine kinase n=1 Tax=Dactylosporangium sp. AC04546 TaxID=2862460 RepID=UPI001EDF864E|nr:sensor histidine kinase [Dactylosporangium sp. AC04546]WVK87996.1 sensor histidine kinase [Dactylosporangium sp. AC04546]
MYGDLDDWRRPGPTARQQRTDLVVGVVFAAFALLNLALARSVGLYSSAPSSAAEQVLWTLLVTLPIAWRRRWPDAVAIMVAAVFIVAQVRSVPEQQLAGGALFCSMYTLGAWGPDHRRAKWIRGGIIAAMFVWLGIFYLMKLPTVTAADFDDAAGPFSPIAAIALNGVLINLLIFAFAYFFGEIAWIAARRQHQLEVQADQLRASQAEARERAVMGERVRIARELHDVVAHHVSVMGVQASAARRVLDRDQVKAKTALASVEQSARTAVDELRRMLSLLRHGDGPDRQTAGAGLDRVDDLVVSAREAGLTASAGVFGEPADLPDSLSQAAYRIVQEAVTNTIKHAGATTIDVRIRYLADELEVDVADNGRGSTGAGTGGLGLIGMRERVAAHDGVLEAGGRTGGGYRVRARFPLERTVEVA